MKGEVTIMVKALRIDEQRFHAREMALDAAVRMVTGGGRNLVNNDSFVTEVAERFEEWLMRPLEADPAGGRGPGLWMCACGARQPCAAHPAPSDRESKS